MKISLSWLSNYLTTSQTAPELAATLTKSGIEVKNIFQKGAAISKVVAAQIMESIQHPNADRLSVCKVDDGSGVPRQIVCGAKNFKVGDKILLSLPGAILPGGVKIKVGKLRGVESEGMMCSSKELGLGEGVEGLHILPSETVIGTELSALFPADTVFELEITPNRPDWLGHVGVAREAAAFGAGEFMWKAPVLPSFQEDPGVVSIAVVNDCSFYTAQRINGIAVKPSPVWLSSRLEAIGLRSINNVVDITNYVMMETGHPLHAFDAAKIKGALVVRYATAGETFLALDGKSYSLSANDLVIADEEGPQALAGVIGGMTSSVTEKTTELLLESAVFHSSLIRSMARSHGILTDAAYRFERGTGAGIALEASARATALIVEIAGGTAAPKLAVAGMPTAPVIVPLRSERCRQLLGIDISNEQIAQYLQRLGLTQIEGGWQIPVWRHDLTREIDLVEEVSRLYGIESVPSRCLAIPASSSKADKEYDRIMLLRRQLTAQGFYEARTSTLVAPEKTNSQSTIEPLVLRNPMGEQQSVLRTSLLQGILAVLEHNLRQGASTVRIFEIGKIFQAHSHTHSSLSQSEESLSLGFIMTGIVSSPTWRHEPERFLDLFDLKGALDHLAPKKISYRATSRKNLPLALSLALDVLYAGEICGIIGIMAPAEARKMMLTGQEHPIVIGEINLNLFQEGEIRSWKNGIALPKFPAIQRDFALIANESVAYELIEKSLMAAEEAHLISIQPFDIFIDPAGERVPLGQKSIAITLTFQHPDQTLTTEEVDASCDRLLLRLEQTVGAKVRG